MSLASCLATARAAASSSAGESWMGYGLDLLESFIQVLVDKRHIIVGIEQLFDFFQAVCSRRRASAASTTSP